MAYLDTIDERVIYRAHLHWIIFVRPILIIIIGAICLAACLAVSDDILWRCYFGVVPFIGFVDLINSFITKISTELAITEKSVIAKRGFISRDTVELSLARVESARVTQSILGRILNYGSVGVIGTGNSYTPIPYIADPLRFRNVLSDVL